MNVGLLLLVLAPTSDSTLRARLDSALVAEARAGFSGVVLVTRGPRLLLERAYGRAGSGAGADLPAFWFASNSKQFTAAAVLMAVLSNAGEAGGSTWSSRVNRTVRRIMDPPR